MDEVEAQNHGAAAGCDGEEDGVEEEERKIFLPSVHFNFLLGFSSIFPFEVG